MVYDNNPMNNRDNYQLKNRLSESEDQRTRRQNRIGAVIFGFVVLAFIGGYIATMDKHPENGVVTPTTAMNTTPSGTTEAAIAPASGNTTVTTTTTTPAITNEVSNDAAVATTATTATSTSTTANSPGATTATPATTTEPVTENPKVYTSEESCRSIVGGACQPISGGWTPVNPAPEKTAVPEAVAPAMTATSPSDDTAD